MAKIFSVMFFILLLGSNLSASDYIRNFDISIGMKKLDSDDWGDFDKQFMFGMRFDFQTKKFPVSYVFDIAMSTHEKKEEGLTLSASTYEFNTGLRKYFFTNQGKVIPYFGAGVGLMLGELMISDGFEKDSVRDSGLNLWADIGIKFKFHEKITFGFDYKFSKAKIELFDTDIEAGGSTFAFLFGIQF